MEFIMGSLMVFNGETLNSFLTRAWRIVNGTATKKELLLTIAHTCAFYFMRNAKTLVKQTLPKNQSSLGMWMLSLLMNMRTLEELERAVHLILIVTCSKYSTERVKKSISDLNKWLCDFRWDLSQDVKDYLLDESFTKLEGGEKRKEALTEEELCEQANDSPFKQHFTAKYKHECDINKKDNTTASLNTFYSEKFFPAVLKRFLPTVPLWSCLLLGDLSRHGEGASEYEAYKAYFNANPRREHTVDDNFSDRTTWVSEKRMGDVYNSLLGGKKAARLDDIVSILYDNVIGMQKMFADSLLSSMIYKKKNRVIQESWDKRRGKRSMATYQNGSCKDETIKVPDPNAAKTKRQAKGWKTKAAGKKSPEKKSKTTNSAKASKKISRSTSNVGKHARNTTSNFATVAFVKSVLTGIPNPKNNCWFNSVMVAMLNTYGSFRAFETPDEDTVAFMQIFGNLISSMDIRKEGSSLTSTDLKGV